MFAPKHSHLQAALNPINFSTDNGSVPKLLDLADANAHTLKHLIGVLAERGGRQIRIRTRSI
jgi:hypothetical protein